MDFRDELKAAAEETVEKHRNGVDHVIRQAFYDGVRFYMEYARKRDLESPPLPPQS